MKFLLSYNPDYPIGKPKFILAEQSFYFDPYIESDFTLMVGCSYLGLNISTKSRCIVNLSGLCPEHLWRFEELKLPKEIVKCSIMIDNMKIIGGTGKYLSSESFIIFDKKSGWFCIKTNVDLQPDTNVEFAENCILSLVNGNFVSLWIKPEFE